MSAPTDVQTRTIVIDRLELLREGFSPRTRKPYRLYKVHANDLAGDPIGGELRTFDALAGTVEVTFEPRVDGDGNVESHTLREVRKATDIRTRRRQAREALTGGPAPASPTSANGDDLAALRKRVDDLEARFEAFAAIFGPDDAA